MLVGGGAIEHMLVCITLGDGPSTGTLNSGVVGDRGCSILGDGELVVIGFDVPWWRTGRRISCRCWARLVRPLACARQPR
jgi:hypothetical protein